MQRLIYSVSKLLRHGISSLLFFCLFGMLASYSAAQVGPALQQTVSTKNEKCRRVECNGATLFVLPPSSASKESVPLNVFLVNLGKETFLSGETGYFLDCNVKLSKVGGEAVPYSKLGRFLFGDERDVGQQAGFSQYAILKIERGMTRHWQLELTDAFEPLDAGEYLLSLQTSISWEFPETGKRMSHTLVAEQIDITVTEEDANSSIGFAGQAKVSKTQESRSDDPLSQYPQSEAFAENVAWHKQVGEKEVRMSWFLRGEPSIAMVCTAHLSKYEVTTSREVHDHASQGAETRKLSHSQILTLRKLVKSLPPSPVVPELKNLILVSVSGKEQAKTHLYNRIDLPRDIIRLYDVTGAYVETHPTP